MITPLSLSFFKRLKHGVGVSPTLYASCHKVCAQSFWISFNNSLSLSSKYSVIGKQNLTH